MLSEYNVKKLVSKIKSPSMNFILETNGTKKGFEDTLVYDQMVELCIVGNEKCTSYHIERDLFIEIAEDFSNFSKAIQEIKG
jgi:hypothetical protein